MVETELKLLVPEAARCGVERELFAGGRSTSLRLQAIYFDTADRRLAAAGLSLRLRKEGRRWVQALKGAGDGALRRLEHEMALDGPAQPRVDAARHAGTPAGDRLAALLADGAPLAERFRTDVRRRRRAARARDGGVELAFDVGAIVAGEARSAIAELEIELTRGAPQAVLDVARRWIVRHALVLDLRSKAERGDRLARGETCAAPCKAVAPRLERAQTEAQSFAATVAACLEQVLANAGPVVDGVHGAEHVHQLRVGLRRLRSALRLFDGAAPAGLDERAAALFRRLGSTRDRDALAAGVLPQLRAAGAPLADLPPEAGTGDGHTPVQALREPEASLLWLDLLALADTPDAARPRVDAPPLPLDRALGVRLAGWHRQVRRAAKRFDELDADARHTLRKRFKRLRYAIEFCTGLYRAKAVERYLRRLRPVQDAFGVLNDLQVAASAFERLTADDPRAWFALGWLASRREATLGECRAALRRFRNDAEPFWSA